MHCKITNHFATLLGVVGKHLWQFLQIVAGDTVRENMHRVACFPHVEAGGLHTGGSVS